MRSLVAENRQLTGVLSNRPHRVSLRGLGLGCLALLVIALMAPSHATAQMGGTATIEGTISDSTGAVVVGAKVAARNVATGSETVRTTTKAASTRFPRSMPATTPLP